MKIKLWHLLTLIDNKDYIDLRIYKVYESGYATCQFGYDDLHKEDIVNNLKMLLHYNVKFMYWYDNHLVLEIYDEDNYYV